MAIVQDNRGRIAIVQQSEKRLSESRLNGAMGERERRSKLEFDEMFLSRMSTEWYGFHSDWATR